MTLSYDIADVAAYINWVYFDHAWGMSGKPDVERQALHDEAAACLHRLEGRYMTHAVFQLFDCHSDGDDIVLSMGGAEVRGCGGTRIPCLRQQQQGSEYLCLADFIPTENVISYPRTPVPSYPRSRRRGHRLRRSRRESRAHLRALRQARQVQGGNRSGTLALPHDGHTPRRHHHPRHQLSAARCPLRRRAASGVSRETCNLKLVT